MKWRLLFSRGFSKVALRPYQQECISMCLNHLAEGTTRQAVSLPVGSGKTFTFSHLIAQIPPPTPRATKVLILAHREELIHQAFRSVRTVMPHLAHRVKKDQGVHAPVFRSTLEVENDGEDPWAVVESPSEDDEAEIIVASVQSLGRKESKRLEKYDPARFKAIVIDEAHHAASATYSRILEHFGVSGNKVTSPILVWGCSATLRRQDGLSLKGVFDKVVYHRDIIQMIQEGWLCSLRVRTVQTAVSLDGVRTIRGDFSEGALAKCVNQPIRNLGVVCAWMHTALPDTSFLTESHQDIMDSKIREVWEWRRKGKGHENEKPQRLPSIFENANKSLADLKRTRTLVFAADVQHANDLMDALRYCGVWKSTTDGEEEEMVRGVWGTMKPFERRKNMEDFRNGVVPLLVNVGILTEGVDIPAIDSVILARPTQSDVLLQQMIGRGLRTFPGKDNCLVVDFHDTGYRSPVATVPTLLGLNPEFFLEGDFEQAHKLVEQSKSETPEIIEQALTMEDLLASLGDPMQFLQSSSSNNIRDDYALLLTKYDRILSKHGPTAQEEVPRRKEVVVLHDEEEFVSFGKGWKSGVEDGVEEIKFKQVRSPTEALLDPKRMEEDSAILARVSLLNWVRIGPNDCAIGLGPGMSIVVLYNEEKKLFEAFLRDRRSLVKGRVPRKPKALASADRLVLCIRACDTFVHKHGSMRHYAVRKAAWRRGPASAAQIKMLKSRGMVERDANEKEAKDAGRKLKSETWVVFNDGKVGQMTKGMASDLILKLVEGGKGRMEREGKKVAKVEKEKEKKRNKVKEMSIDGYREWLSGGGANSL
ncbi:P-loop containing nucleoside triphosphate hydrolase protein [Cladochytrium replicatum]|nr:P-loop containing nucleoside triphosphate hydrolase protein [Cladochytrium replicatum]